MYCPMKAGNEFDNECFPMCAWYVPYDYDDVENGACAITHMAEIAKWFKDEQESNE